MCNLQGSHPNPQRMREDYILLDGEWDFCFDEEDIGILNSFYNGSKWGSEKTINVPYCYQSRRSGIGLIDEVSVVWYKTTVSISEEQKKKRMFLHIGASDYETTVFINGMSVGTHIGGHMPFSFDITDYTKINSNLVVIRVVDNSSPRFPMGKQSYTNKNFACWYTRTTGIWQSVWIEFVSKTHIKNFKFIPHVSTGELEILAEVEGRYANTSTLFLDIFKNKYDNNSSYKSRMFSCSVHNNMARFRISIFDIGFEIPLWTPEHPNLIDAKLSLKSNHGDDIVFSYFGYRDISIFGNQVYLNGRPYYQKLILNQGYYGDGLLTGTDEEFIHDITTTKSMGFNGMRVHQKTESSRFLYHCDRLGLLYWAELASAYSHDSFASINIINEIGAMVKHHENHPCVITWTPFNESWGIPTILFNKRQQQLTLAIREIIRALDEQLRPIISNDGWEHTVSDILTIHDYEQSAEVVRKLYPKSINDINFDSPPTQVKKRFYADGFNYRNEPILLSEYGGIAFEASKYSDKDWGYGETAKTLDEFYNRFEKIHQAFFDLDYIGGLCYTQLTDVQQEINGLLDFDHKPKFDIERLERIMNLKRNV